ncbi:MAG: hypothetical protein HQK79_09820 [Desulfobacterales bacterium]|nr:hypothetical protein [Desulfobacterales bacterium]MBF0395871.1 hypothetical protein [Desulfobacterales bacterium]
MISPAKILILTVGLVASIVVFLIMRFPQLRRAEFRNRKRFSTIQSSICAALMSFLFMILAMLQQ